MDIFRHIEQTHRELVSRRLPAGEGHAVVLRRTYPAAVADVWEACTDADRLSRWFLPVTGELRLGGHYQLEGNAGGEILHCEPPRLLKVTWIFGADPAEAAGTSEVELRLEALGPEETRLELVHAGIETPERWTEFGPGATGVGWDLALLGLNQYLGGELVADPADWEASPEIVEYSRRSAWAWADAHRAAGGPADEAEAAARNTAKFYTGT